MKKLNSLNCTRRQTFHHSTILFQIHRPSRKINISFFFSFFTVYFQLDLNSFHYFPLLFSFFSCTKRQIEISIRQCHCSIIIEIVYTFHHFNDTASITMHNSMPLHFHRSTSLIGERTRRKIHWSISDVEPSETRGTNIKFNELSMEFFCTKMKIVIGVNVLNSTLIGFARMKTHSLHQVEFPFEKKTNTI